MAQVVRLTFNPFAENTYLVVDEGGECAIIDPGCYSTEEENLLREIIVGGGWRPVRLLNTHGHIDHVLGNGFVREIWGLEAEIHPDEYPAVQSTPMVAGMYGIPLRREVPPPGPALVEGQEIRIGATRLKCILAPGHSPGHLCFYCAEEGFLIGGDVLFEGSIGRTDLPGGDWDTLLASIRREIYTLPDETTVWPGHGEETTVGREARTNPFVRR